MSDRKSLEAALKQLAEYISALACNWKEANAADQAADEIQGAGLGVCSVDVAWHSGGGASVVCVGRIDKEADMRRLIHSAAEAHGLALGEPKRIDSLKTCGSIEINYGPLRLRILPDGNHCKRVQVGTKQVPAREEPIYEIVCEEPKAEMGEDI